MTIVAIHQPNFFPWLGYFEKIAKSDVFIFLDNVQFQKTGGTWSNRVMLLEGSCAKWVTAPVNRKFHGVRNINEIEFQSPATWRTNLMAALIRNYKAAPHFDDTMDLIAPLVSNPDDRLSTYNGYAVMTIAKLLGIPADRFRWSSDLHVAGQSNELLIGLTKAVGGNIYMCGGGASGYQDEALFNFSGVRLTHQNFAAVPYPQNGMKNFASGLSIVDALMNIGISGVSQLLRNHGHLQKLVLAL